MKSTENYTWHIVSIQKMLTIIIFVIVITVIYYFIHFLYSTLSYESQIKLPFYCKAIQTCSSQYTHCKYIVHTTLIAFITLY